jgi:hypothetical protein
MTEKTEQFQPLPFVFQTEAGVPPEAKAEALPITPPATNGRRKRGPRRTTGRKTAGRRRLTETLEKQAAEPVKPARKPRAPQPRKYDFATMAKVFAGLSGDEGRLLAGIAHALVAQSAASRGRLLDALAVLFHDKT